MFKSIKINNFKAIGDKGLQLNNLNKVNYLVGKNGSGKTSIIEALSTIYWFFNPTNANNTQNLKTYKQEIEEQCETQFFLARPYETPIHELINSETVVIIELEDGRKTRFISPHSKILKHEKLVEFKEQKNDIFYFINVKINSESNEGFRYNRINLPENNPLSHLAYIASFNELLSTFGVNDKIEMIPEEQIEEFVFRFSKTGEKVQFELLASGLKHLFQLHLSIKDNIKQALKYNDIPKFINNCQIIFMFEEVERFLHPSLQKLVPTIFEEVYKDVLMEGENDKVVKERLKFLITTHSPYITNSALKISNQKVYHIENGECIDPNGVSGLEINTFNSIMDSLGVKPSDMLFANGIIWVEGSADVIYIQKWLDMYAKENNLIEFKQGFDYEFCMYGGALLKFLYGSNGDKLNKANLINIIRINTRKFLITDSDRQVLEAEDKSTFEEAKKLMQQCLGEDNFWCDPQVRTIEEYAVENKGKGMKGNKTWQYHPNCRYDASVDKTERAFKRVQLWEKENVKLRNFKPSLLTNISRLYEEIRKWNN